MRSRQTARNNEGIGGPVASMDGPPAASTRSSVVGIVARDR
ncbi:hypothetical protein AB0L40_11445 [Patulibacter sp. NPDC049589]